MKRKFLNASTLKFVLGIGGLVLFTGCKKFVEIPPPNTQLVTTNVFNNSGSATTALLGIYIQMANNGESINISMNSGLLGDELTSHSIVTSEQQLYNDALTPINDLGRWVEAYNYIY